jgi:hypothetical protein
MLRYSLVIFITLVAGCSSSGMSQDELGDSGSGGNGANAGTGGRAGGSGSAGSNSSGSSAGPASGGNGGTANQAGEAAEAGDTGSGGTRGGKAGTGGTGGTGGGAGAVAGTGGGTGGSGAPANHTNPLGQELIDAFVKAHNDARASNLVPPPSPPLPPVEWDAALADSVYNYLSKCESGDGNLVDHNDNRTKDYAALGGSDYVGENLYASSASSIDPVDAVDSWMSEAPDYAAGNVSKAGHYTQVVWRDSVRIGCAIVNCPSLRFHNTVLCDYAPGGNINGQTPY